MRLSQTLIAFFLFVSTIIAHPLTTEGEDEDAKKLEQAFSLPDLVKLKDNSVPSHWQLSDSTKLNEGRVILTPQVNSKGSLWLKNAYPLKDAFTIEWTFRSVGFVGKSPLNGLAFWFINEKGLKDDHNLFNGPSKFDGLNFVVDSNGPTGPSIRAQLNDGSASFTNEIVYDQSFAYCLFGYQDSSVPSTIRLTYDRSDDNLLKLQVDNRVCFQTRKIQLPESKYKIGVSATVGKDLESFEILKMNLYNGVIHDSLIPNVNAMGQPRFVTKMIDTKTGKEKLVDKETKNMLEDKVTNYEIMKKLNRVEGKVLANDISGLEEQLNQIIKLQSDLIKYMEQFSSTVNSQLKVSGGGETGKETSSEQFKDLLNFNENVKKMLDETERLREQNKNVNLQGPHIDDIVARLAVWLVPLFLIVAVLAYYTFKIRQEIVKTKLL